MDRRSLSVFRPLPGANGSSMVSQTAATARLGVPRTEGEHSRFVVESYRHLATHWQRLCEHLVGELDAQRGGLPEQSQRAGTAARPRLSVWRRRRSGRQSRARRAPGSRGRISRAAPAIVTPRAPARSFVFAEDKMVFTSGS